MRKRAKVDATHGEIVQTFRQCGWAVLSLAPLGNGAPDLLVYGYKHGSHYLYLVEVKAGKGKLRHEQVLFGARRQVAGADYSECGRRAEVYRPSREIGEL